MHPHPCVDTSFHVDTYVTQVNRLLVTYSSYLQAFFKMNTELVNTHGVTQVPEMPYLDNMVGWRYSSVPGHTDDFEPCALSKCAA